MAKEMRENNKRAPRKDGFREVEKEFKEELLEVARVTRVTAGGRQLRFRAAVVVGNGKGTVGLGTGKAAEVVVAIEKAVRDAKKNLITFPIIAGTVPHEIKANFKATSVLLHPASEGTGVIAGGAIRKLLFVSGLKDVLAKRFGGRNQMTNVRAALRALAGLKPIGATASFMKAAAPAVSETAPVAVEEKAAPTKKAPAKKPAAKKEAAAE
ncbi:MAG: small subunit ribosomal protein [Patescibacteria group bacterium]|nr:small subunit ribosomal protein [Patescibacteria group bacterium]